MIFGEKERFAIEVCPHDSGLAALRIWVAGTPFGDDEQSSVLRSLQLDASRFVSSAGDRTVPDAATYSPARVRSWLAELMEGETASVEEAETLDQLIEAIQLFAFAPEGLASIRVVVACDESNCLVTAWDTIDDVVQQILLDVDEVDDVVDRFAKWHPE